MELAQHFLIIDDDPSNNFLCKFIIRKTFEKPEIHDFTSPEKAVEHIKEIASKDLAPTVILLDINMPVMSGWEILDYIDSMEDDLKNRFTIFMLTSSIDPADRRRANAHPLVVAYLEKPLSKEKLKEVMGLMKLMMW